MSSTGQQRASDEIRRGFPVLAAFLLSGLTAAVGVRYGIYAASYSDVSGYVAQAELWSTGQLFRPVPLQLWASWPNAAESGSPLGFRPGLISGTEVPLYPPGMPLLMATARRVVGEYGPYLVAPAFGGILVFATFLLGRSAGGAAAGLIAAALVAVSPNHLVPHGSTDERRPSGGLLGVRLVP